MITLGLGALIGGVIVYITQKKEVRIEIKDHYKSYFVGKKR